MFYLRKRKISIARSAAIEEVSCFKTVGTSAPPQEDKAKTAVALASTEELLKLVVNDLIKHKDKKPGKVATLRNVIHVRCGKNMPATRIDAVYNALVKHGYVKINGAKVTYALPASSS